MFSFLCLTFFLHVIPSLYSWLYHRWEPFSIIAYLMYLYPWDVILYFLTTAKLLMKDPIPNSLSCLSLVPFLKLPLKNIQWTHVQLKLLLIHNIIMKSMFQNSSERIVFSLPILTVRHGSNCSFHWLLLEPHVVPSKKHFYFDTVNICFKPILYLEQ